jgi:hypothetical protein
MAGKHSAEKLKRLETVSTERRKLIGQAIIDGLISPGEAAFSPIAADPDYDQGQGGYTQKGGDHRQGGGDYNQSQALTNIRDLVTNVIQPGQVLQPGNVAGGVTRGGGR